ncbi:hypothetical protein MKW98_005462 [Papaver atlanticum]|uniref:Uncharacterized protein n=1 Tax=Papaver atlanticum TaxID=357466 RepID=A0AAD4T647_9MAGN|nr:hypothetical protein MKW98_005462 [Papaver atlanticum]
MVSQPVPFTMEELDCKLHEFLTPDARKMSDVDRKLKELKVILEIVIADQRKIADEVQHSHNKALLKLFDQLPTRIQPQELLMKTSKI